MLRPDCIVLDLGAETAKLRAVFAWRSRARPDRTRLARALPPTRGWSGQAPTRAGTTPCHSDASHCFRHRLPSPLIGLHFHLNGLHSGRIGLIFGRIGRLSRRNGLLFDRNELISGRNGLIFYRNGVILGRNGLL